jgi:SAM-dependent methyltransferase
MCPITRQALSVCSDGLWLTSDDGTQKYPLLNGKVPVLLTDPKWAEKYASGSETMAKEYRWECGVTYRPSLLKQMKSKLAPDYRTGSSTEAFREIFLGLSSEPLCLSIGGGPKRSHPMLTNLNIGAFPNVDIVADAHVLPYADACVDAVYSEAVFEHLSDPVRAASEIHRVLKPSGKAFICTPFMQAYHGYPYHYQNFTLTGHKHLFESTGFELVDAGTCVGPVYTVMDVVTVFLNEYVPFPLNRIFRIAWETMGVFIRPLDRKLGRRENAHVLASSTYVLIRKY